MSDFQYSLFLGNTIKNIHNYKLNRLKPLFSQAMDFIELQNYPLLVQIINIELYEYLQN